ncbi:hypothetical protein LCGC14_2835880, partial [marine sediment metagenome]
MKRLGILLVVALAGASVLADSKPIDRFKIVADRMVVAINAADYDAVGQDFGKVMADAFPQAKRAEIFKGIAAQYGKIRKLDTGRYTPPHTAIFPARHERGVLDIKIVLDQQDKIIGLWFLPHTADIPTPKKHQTKLSLPFEGEWHVYWGGDTKQLNQHHDTANQRFAFDLLVVDAA